MNRKSDPVSVLDREVNALHNAKVYANEPHRLFEKRTESEKAKEVQDYQDRHDNMSLARDALLNGKGVEGEDYTEAIDKLEWQIKHHEGRIYQLKATMPEVVIGARCGHTMEIDRLKLFMADIRKALSILRLEYKEPEQSILRVIASILF